MTTVEEYESQIEDFILEAYDYPTAQELLDKFILVKPFDFPSWLRAITALNNLITKGHILYDGKHDIWLYTKPTEKQMEWLKKAVSI